MVSKKKSVPIMSEMKDMKMDKKMGVKEGSKKDMKMDKKAGVIQGSKKDLMPDKKMGPKVSKRK